jgi:hypothetical protein
MGVKEDEWKDDDVLMLERWWTKTKARRAAHEFSGNTMGRIHKWVAFPSVLVGAVLSSVTFQPDAAPAFLAPALSVFITLTASTQAFFGFEKKAEGHRRVSKSFGSLQRSIELEIVRQASSFEDFFERLNQSYSQLIEEAPFLTAEGKAILEREGRGSSTPNPFDTYRPVATVT